MPRDGKRAPAGAVVSRPGQHVAVPALRLIAYLGADADITAAAIADGLTEALGRPVEAATAASWLDRRAAIARGDADVLWMCGLATVEALDAGDLDMDIVAAPIHEERERAIYHSVVIAHRDRAPVAGKPWTTLRLAMNEPTSWSGFHALRVHLVERGEAAAPFREVIQTGGHLASIEALLDGRADIAAIDDTIWRRWIARDPRATDLIVVERTRDWPAPPFSVARRLDERLRRTIAERLPELRPAGLTAIVPAADADYDPIRKAMAVSRAVPW